MAPSTLSQEEIIMPTTAVKDNGTKNLASDFQKMLEEKAKSNVATGQKFQLTGFERLFTMGADASAIIASVVTFRGEVNVFGLHLAEAVRRVFNVHPKMRIKLLPGVKPLTAIVCPPLSREEAESIVHIHSVNTEELQDNDLWQHFVEQECNRALNRETEFPYYVHVFVDKTSNSFARLCLFSDHFMSDAFSHTVIINSILDNISFLSAEETPTNGPLQQEYPLRPGLYDWLVGETKQRTFLGLLSRQRLGKWLEFALNRITKNYKPLLPLDSSLKDFYLPNPPKNGSRLLFASGTKERLQQALKRCKAEKVTMNGALIAATAIALGLAEHGGTLKTLSEKRRRLHSKVNAAYNMRKRVTNPVIDEPHVGLFVVTNSLTFLEKDGIDVNARFWDVARRAKQETDKSASNFLAKMTITLAHERLNAEVTDSSIFIPKGVGGLDWTISNLGRYELPVTHSVGQGKELRMESFHFGSSNPHMSCVAGFCVSSLNGLHHCMQSRVESSMEKQLFAYYLQSVDAIGDITEQETILSVSERVVASLKNFAS